MWAHLACLEAHAADGFAYDLEHYICRACQRKRAAQQRPGFNPGRLLPGHAHGHVPTQCRPPAPHSGFPRSRGRKRGASEREPSRLGAEGRNRGRAHAGSAAEERCGNSRRRELSWGDPDELEEGAPPGKRRAWGSRAGEGDAAQQHPARLLERDAARRRARAAGAPCTALADLRARRLRAPRLTMQDALC